MLSTAPVSEETVEIRPNQNQGIQLKRQVVVKTMVNPAFKNKANEDLSEEIKLIESQAQQLEAQVQYSFQQLETAARNGQNVSAQLEQLNREAQEKRNQLAGLKLEVATQLGNLDKVPNGTYIVTGMLENFVEVRVGDNIYEKLRNAEILVEDGVIVAING